MYPTSSSVYLTVKENLLFNSQGGPASAILTTEGAGTDIVNVALLDRVVSDRISFIKMDIEGWELPCT